MLNYVLAILIVKPINSIIIRILLLVKLKLNKCIN